MSRLVIRNTPADIVRQLKVRALKQGLTLSALVNDILTKHAQGKVKP